MSRHLNIKKCRTCLSENIAELVDWCSYLEAVQDKVTYMECYRECTHLDASIDDSLPQTLCHSCVKQLGDAYIFIKMAKESNQTLHLKEEHLLEVDGTEFKQAGFEWVGVQKDDCNNFPTASIKIMSDPPSQAFLKMEHEDEISDEQDVCLPEENNLPLEEYEEPAKDSIDISKNVATLVKRKRSNHKTIEDSPNNKGNADLETVIKCKICDESFTQKDIKRHTARAHKVSLMLCHACPRTFKDASNLRIHAETHEENRERNYTCEKCGRKFFTKTAYQSHAKIHENNRKAAFQCDQCEKSFFHKGSLKLHMKSHTGATIECKICSKKYIRAIDLEIHLRSHSGDTPYNCPYCKKSFTQVGILNKHVRHHEGYRYKCEICSKEYLHQSTLIQHRKEHTGLPLKCSICEKGFVKKSKLKRHIGGVHKIKKIEQMEELIVKVKTKREYRGRVLEIE